MERGADVSTDVVAILIDRDEYLPLTYFDKIYVVDLCQPLLDIARDRCRQKGWKHVEFLCQDASQFAIPEWESGQLDPRGSLSAITMSYSLSMVSQSRSSTQDVLTPQIPTFYQLLDRCDQVLDQQSGLMGVVDFYTSRSQESKERVRLRSCRSQVPYLPSTLIFSQSSLFHAPCAAPHSFPQSHQTELISRLSAHKARECHSWLSGSGKRGLRWTASTFTRREEVG